MSPAEIYEIAEYGDAGLLVTFRHVDPEDRWNAARAVQHELLQETAVIDVVASFQTAFISIDPLRIDRGRLDDLIGQAIDRPPPASGDVFAVPAVYGGDHGPDLHDVAAELGLTPEELIALHVSEPWTVRLCGSPAGAPMMDGPSVPQPVARNPQPRTSLPAGSVALSGQQCMIYPVASPGGWRLIGRTPVRLFDVEIDGLVPYRPGDRLRFFPIDERAWDDWVDRPLRRIAR